MPTPPKPPEPPQPPFVVVPVDRDDLSETFASSLRRWWVEGLNFHLEFIVNRPAETTDPDAPPTYRMVPVLRLVMPQQALVQLHDSLTKLMASLQQESPIKPTVDGPRSIN